MKVTVGRLHDDLKALGNIGFTKDLGTTRLSYTSEYKIGRDFVKEAMEKAGLVTEIDAVGNLIGRLPGKINKVIATGSHIDTVPNGGIYDGTLGVLAGIECIRTLKENNYSNLHTIEVIAFIEEEGNVLGGTFGSKVLTGQNQEISTLQKIKNYSLSENSLILAKKNKDDYKCFLELHIEQGGVLEKENTQIGIVEGIVGIARYKITVNGKANHAGTTPMDFRDDALVKSCDLILKIMEISRSIDPKMTCTVGTMEILPGVTNVIPGKVDFSVEFRSIHTNRIRSAIENITNIVNDKSVIVDRFLWQDSTELDSNLKNIIEGCCLKEKISYMKIASGAGHDSINMSKFTPTAMIFVPSIGGISHSINEKTSLVDIETGCQLLLNSIVELDKF